MAAISSAVEVALVTGAGSGIGAATAVRLAQRGATVALVDLSVEGLTTTAEAVRASGGVALELRADVSEEGDLAPAVQEAIDELGALRTVVACAGVEVTGRVAEMAIEDWHRVVAVNLTGVFLTARHTIPSLAGNGGGAFVALSSDAGVQGAAGFAAYCATKHGVLGLVRSLALDHGPQGVRVNAICPGFVETPMADRIFADAPEAERRRWQRLVPLGRFARPEEVAEAVAHVSSAEASYLNGHAYVLDGGSSAGYFEG